MDALEVCLAFLDSGQYITEVVDKFCHSLLGKVKVALACKASCDFLISRLPHESRSASDNFYPQQYSTEVVEKFCHSLLGKVNVALVCKAGCDFLVSRLPHESCPTPDSFYPPHVSCNIDLLKELEARGGVELLWKWMTATTRRKRMLMKKLLLLQRAPLRGHLQHLLSALCFRVRLRTPSTPLPLEFGRVLTGGPL